MEPPQQESLLSMFIEYYWDERDGQFTEQEEVEFRNWMHSVNILRNNELPTFARFWLNDRIVQLRNEAGEARIELNNEIEADEQRVQEAQETNRAIKCAQLADNLKWVLEFLFNAKDKVDYIDKDRLTVLHHLIGKFMWMREALSQNVRSRLHNLIRKLTARGASLYTVDVFGRSPLALAAECKNAEVRSVLLVELLSCGLDVVLDTNQLQKIIDAIDLLQEAKRIPSHFATTFENRKILRAIISSMKYADSLLHKLLHDYNFEHEDAYNFIVRVLVSNNPYNHIERWDEKDMSPLRVALDKCLVKVLQVFANQRVSFKRLNNAEETGLHLVCQSPLLLNNDHTKLLETIDFLISKGCRLNDVDKNGFTPMHNFVQFLTGQHIYSSDLLPALQRLTKQLIERGATLFALDKQVNSPLHIAAMAKNQHIIQMLISCLDDVDACDNNGNTPLHIVLENCYDEQAAQHKADYVYVVCKLVGRGADLDKRNKAGLTPVHLAAAKLHIEILQLFQDHKANFKLHSYENESALHIACKSSLNLKEKCKLRETINLLINQGCEPTAYDNNGYMPLHLAAQFGSSEMLHELIMHGVDITCKTKNMQLLTPLHLAAKQDRLDFIKKLVEAGADVNAEAADGTTPIFQSVQFGSYDSMKYFVDRGADLHRRDENLGFTLLHFDVYGNDFKRHEGKKFDLLLKKNFNINDAGTCGITPLQLASLVGNENAVKALIEHNANIDFQSDKSDLTALHCALLTKQLEIIEMLIEAGADLNSRSCTEQSTALHLALATNWKWNLGKYNNENTGNRQLSLLSNLSPKCNTESRFISIDIVKMLIKHGADVNAKDASGRSPLHLASLHSDGAFLKILLQAGAHPNAVNREGQTIVSNIVKMNNKAALSLWLDFGADINETDISQELMKSKDALTVIAIKQAIKLKCLGLAIAKVYESFVCKPEFANFVNQCSKEVKALKENRVANYSLYEFLRMYLENRYICVQIMPSSFASISKLCPLYLGLIQGACRYAVRRQSLVQAAMSVWYQISTVYLPDVCVENVFSHAGNKYLNALVESVNPVEQVLLDKSKQPVLYGCYIDQSLQQS